MDELKTINFTKDLCRLNIAGRPFESYCVYDNMQLLEFGFAEINRNIGKLLADKDYKINCSKLRPKIFQSLRFIRDKKRASYRIHKKREKQNKKKKILLTTYSITWGKNLKGEKVDLFLENIIPEIKNYDLSFIDIDIYRKFDKAKLKEKVDGIENLYPFESFMTKSIYKKTNKVSKELIKTWNSIKNDKAFDTLAEKYSVDVRQIKNILEIFFRKRVHEAVLYFETWKNILDKEEPDAVVLVHDREAYGIAAKFATNKLGIPTIAIQSGLLYYKHWAVHPFLKYPEKYISFKPTKTCLYGDFSKKLLMENGLFKEKELKITGQVRTDPLTEEIKNFDKNEICKEYNLNPSKKIFVFATQRHGAGTKNTTENLFSIWKQFDDAQLIVKVHPRADTKFYEECAKKYSIKPIITKEFNLYKTLFACDAMMTTVWSTTALEAMIFNKPVISANFTGEPPLLPFVERKAALGATTSKELKDAINKSLFDKDSRDNVIKHGKDFLADFFYKVDGKVHKRIAEVIDKEIKNN